MSVIPPEITRRVTGAALWTYTGVLSDRVLRFVVFLVVARLVKPSEFGVVLLSLLAVEAVQALLNTGVPTALLQEQEVPPPLLDTAFWINALMSALASLILFLGAGALADFSHMPAEPLLRVLALTPLITGLGAIHVALIQRKLGFKKLAARQAVASVIASALALAMAFAGIGVWALVARTVVLAIVATVAAWIAAPYRPSLRIEPAAAREAIASGARLWGSGLATMVNARGFDWLAGLSLGPIALAALRIAGQSVMLLIDLTVMPMTALGFALLARAKHDPVQFDHTVFTVSRVAALLIFPAFAGLYVTADQSLPLMFGARWAPAAAVLPYMCAIAPALYFQFLITATLFAAGRSDRLLHWGVIEAVVTIAFSFIGGRYGLVGLAAAGTIRLYLMMPLGWYWLRRDAGISPSRLIAAGLPPLVAALAMAACVAFARTRLLPVLSAIPLLIVLIAIGVVIYGALSWFMVAELWRAIASRGVPTGEDSQRVALAVNAAAAVADPQ